MAPLVSVSCWCPLSVDVKINGFYFVLGMERGRGRGAGLQTENHERVTLRNSSVLRSNMYSQGESYVFPWNRVVFHVLVSKLKRGTVPRGEELRVRAKARPRLLGAEMKPRAQAAASGVPLGVYSLRVFIFLKEGKSLKVLICAETSANGLFCSRTHRLQRPLLKRIMRYLFPTSSHLCSS